jgi:hypothetical protein
MIIAELYGKIPSNLDQREDILTSNVFSFFKYSDRQFFKEYLSKLGLIVSLDETKNAEFLFWQSYEDRTEPDLVVVCGKYYLLIEAKLYSDFSSKTEKLKSQIEREIFMGKMAAQNLEKEFVYIALTSEYFKNKTKYIEYEKQDFLFIWTNWQFIANFISEKIENVDYKLNNEFASDLFLLLVKKKLRSFVGIKNINRPRRIFLKQQIFYNLRTSKFKGEFTGYIENLSRFEKTPIFPSIFKKSFFVSLNKLDINNNQKIFYDGS